MCGLFRDSKHQHSHFSGRWGGHSDPPLHSAGRQGTVGSSQPLSALPRQFTKLVALQGHQDWIRSLDFATCDDGSLLLASASQDTKIRLWKIADSAAAESHSLLSSLNTSKSITTISSKAHLFKLMDKHFTVYLESVLAAHEDWVYSVRWHPRVEVNGTSCSEAVGDSFREEDSAFMRSVSING